MKNLQLAGFWILVFIIFGVFFWSLWPSHPVKESYEVDLNQPLIIEQRCINENGFEAISVEVVHSNFINAGQIASMRIHIQNRLEDINTWLSGCSLALEMYLDLEKGFVFPGNHIMQNLIVGNVQVFDFKIQPHHKASELLGNLWVYLFINEETREEKIPLLVIPVQIRVRSLWAFPMTQVRIISRAAGFLLMFAKLIYRKSG